MATAGTSEGNDIAQARLELNSDIALYAALDEKSGLNALTPIGRLPTELLAEILVCVAFADYSGPDYCNRAMYWIKAAHVCRMFRDTAIGTPRFWSYLRLTPKGHVFVNLVPLSKDAPLHVTGIYHLLAHPTVLSTFVEHSRRLRELRIKGSSRQLQVFFHDNALRLDILETLIVVDLGYEEHRSDFQPPPSCIPSSDVAPRLRHLKVVRFPFRGNDLVRCSHTLSTLILATVPYAGRLPLDHVGTLREFFTGLEAIAPGLEHLRLFDILALQVPSTSLERSLSRSIPIPVLKELRLVGETVNIAYVLEHLALPSTVFISLDARGHMGHEELRNALMTIFSPVNPLLLAKFMISSTEYYTTTIEGWRNIGDGTAQDLSMCVKFSRGNPEFRPPYPPALVLGSFGSLFAHVQELVLSGSAPSNEWITLFSAMPSVETLSLDGYPGYDLFLALMAPLQDSITTVLLPALRVLNIRRWFHHIPFGSHRDVKDYWADFVGFHIFRCNYGVPIDKVALRECTFLWREGLESLREVVVDVEWDGRKPPPFWPDGKMRVD
ncbi:hypothetical protein C2E23DRAFT_807602 [Lenzites betulinus]|nr:hypothetical protein C2E23DRAFT_807602 [Lenzites betulinus]